MVSSRSKLRPICLVVLAMLVGFAAGRASETTDPPPQPPRAAPGPQDVHLGVPARFPRTSKGAVAAMLSHGAALSDPRVLLNPRRRTQVLSVIATPRYARSFTGRSAAGLEAARAGPLGRSLAEGAQTLYLASPIAYRLVSYSPQQAVVEGWGVSVVGTASGMEPVATWGKTLTTARWHDGDWRIDAVESKDGPVPALADGQRPAPATEFFARLRGLRGIRHLP
jgi:hypothetical protein